VDLTTKTNEQIDKMNAEIMAIEGLTGAIYSIIPKEEEKPPPPPPPDEAAPDGTAPPPPPGGAVPFARGGLVTRPTYGMVGEAGPELILPLSRPDASAWNYLRSGIASLGRGFVAPQPQINMRTMAPQIGAINMNTNVTSPSPNYVAQTVARSQRQGAMSLGREILRAAAREGF